MVSVWVCFILSVVFIFLEYFQHKQYAEKHPDYDECGSGVIGFVILAISLLVTCLRGAE